MVAHDLSPAAERAAVLVAETTWPPGTIVRVVTSPIGVGSGVSSFAMLSEVRAYARGVAATVEAAHERIAAQIGARGLAVETGMVHGRPEHALVAAAERFDADVIVVGARDHGPIAATLLGSVSRAVVERAPCSVLVARASSISRVVLATDGSAPARHATSIVASWPLFDDVLTLVLGVIPGPTSYARIALTQADHEAAYADTLADAGAASAEAMEAAVEELAAANRRIERAVRVGDAGTQVVAAAESWAADCVVMGAFGEPFLRRLILGSVARKVLDGVSASVLVARSRSATDAG